MYLTYQIYRQTLDELKPYGFKEGRQPPCTLSATVMYKNDIFVEFPMGKHYIIVFFNERQYTSKFFIYWASAIEKLFHADEEKYKIDRFQSVVDIMKVAESFERVKMMVSQKNIEYMLDRLDR